MNSNNKIIDGRCRALACGNLGIAVNTESIPHKTPIEDVRKKVKSLNTRRNLSVTQKSLVAAEEHLKNPKLTQEEICSSWGVGANNFYNAKYLIRHRPDYAKLLIKGYSVQLGENKKSESIQAVANHVKGEIERLKANAISLPDANFDVNKAITTQAGKQWFVDAVDAVGGFNQRTYSSNDVRRVLASIADQQTTPFP